MGLTEARASSMEIHQYWYKLMQVSVFISMKAASQQEAKKPVLKIGKIVATGSGAGCVLNSAGTSEE